MSESSDERAWQREALPVLHAMTRPDRVPAARYYDPDFYALEVERLWPRVWQMACRLEEIPEPGDFVEYENLSRSVLVVRVDAHTVKAYHNACRHRGVQLAKDRGKLSGRLVCPFHGWCWDLEGRNVFVDSPQLFDQGNLDPDDLSLRECRVELWGGCAFINFDDAAPPCASRSSPSPASTTPTTWTRCAASGGTRRCCPSTGSSPWRPSWRATT